LAVVGFAVVGFAAVGAVVVGCAADFDFAGLDIAAPAAVVAADERKNLFKLYI
jgi:hypothetical protein